MGASFSGSSPGTNFGSGGMTAARTEIAIPCATMMAANTAPDLCIAQVRPRKLRYAMA
jgi:hypothetical protein